MAATEDSEIPETGAVFTFGKSKFADNLPNKFWVKNDRVHQIACGDEHTGLIAESGRVFMFGPNDWGQLGLNDNKGVNKPSCVKSLKHETAKLIACGRSHTLVATESGHIYSFGSNSDGQLGYEGVTDQYLPKQIESLRPTKYKILSAGADDSVALTEDGKVYVWGGNEEGKLGLGEDIEIAHQPMLLQLDRPVVCVACGYYHTALVTDDGKLYTMGETDGGKLGLPEDLEDTKVPQEVTTIAEPVKWVACGSSHTVALTESGKCYVFGEGESGQLGLGTDVLSLSTPTHLKLPFKVSRVYCGQAFTALISEKGQLYTFGDGRHGKLAHGNDQFSNQYKPYHCKRFSHFNVKKVACGGCHMIVTAQPKAHSHNVESDEEVDEMKSLAETALLDSLNMTTGSPTLSRSLSAREKRRNEVTRSLSTLNQTLPVLTSKRGIHPLSATMPAIKPNHSKANGDLLHTTIVPKNRSLPRGKTLDIDHVVGPESTHHKGQVVDNSDDGSEGDDEGSDEGQHSVGHHGPKQVVEEGVVEEKLEADEDVMALTAELQSKIDEGSSEEEPLDEVDERSAGQDLPESITNTREAGIHVEKVQEEMSSKDVITPTEKEKKESPVPGKKNPLPLPRKKQEKAEENEKEHEEEEEEEETEEDEEVNEEEENSKKKNKKNKKEKEEKKKKDGKEDEKDKKKKDGEENEKDKKKKEDKKDKKKKDDDDIKDDKKKEGKEDNKKIDDDEDIKDKKKKDGKEDKKKKEDEESVKDKKKKDGKEDKKDKKEDEDTKDKKKKDEKEPKDKKKDKKSKKGKKKNGEEEEDEEEEEKEDKKKDKKGKKEKEDKKNKKEKNKKGDKDKKGEEEDEEDAEDEESNEKSKKKEKDTKTEDNEKSNDKSKKKGKDAKIEENEKNNSKVDKEKTDEALTKSNDKDDKANGKDENENTQVPVTAKKSRTCSIL